MDWQGKLATMQTRQPGVPQPGSTGNLAYAPGMMDIFNRSPRGVPSARAMQAAGNLPNPTRPQQMLPRRPGTGVSGANSASMPMNPMGMPIIGQDIIQKIFGAIQADGRGY